MHPGLGKPPSPPSSPPATIFAPMTLPWVSVRRVPLFSIVAEISTFLFVKVDCERSCGKFHLRQKRVSKNGHFLHLRGEAMGKLKQMSAKIKRSGSGQTLSSCSSGTDPSTKWLWKFSRLIGGNLTSRKSDANSVQPQVHQLSTDFQWACNARTKYFQLTTEPLEWNFISMEPVVDRSYLDPIFSRSMKLDADAICHSKCPFRTRRSCRSQCGNVLSTCLFLFVLWLFRCLSHSVVTSNESVLR